MLEFNVADFNRADDQQFQQLLDQTRRVNEQLALDVSNRVRERRAQVIADDAGISMSRAMRLTRSMYRDSVLCGSMRLQTDEHGLVYVHELLGDEETYDGATMADPREPDYGGGSCKAKYFVNEHTGQPMIYSQAHGGILYFLKHDYDTLGQVFMTIPPHEVNVVLNRLSDLILNAHLTGTEIDLLLKDIHDRFDIGVRALKVTLKEEKEKGEAEAGAKLSRAVIVEYNARCFVLSQDVKATVHEELNEGDVIVSRTFNDFTQYHQNDTITLMNPGNIKAVEKSKIWLRHPERRAYKKFVFDPIKVGNRAEGGGDYNLFGGFPIIADPLEIDIMEYKCDLILKHIKDIWANGIDEHYHYIMSFFADLFQQPQIKPGVALILMGEPGTGKSILFEEMFSRMLGRLYFKTADQKDIFGVFNEPSCNKLLCILEEAVSIYDKKVISQIKDRITSQTMNVNNKFKLAYTIDDFTRFVLISNYDHVVNVMLKERRYAMFEVSEKRRNDRKYFKDLLDEIRAGGYIAFLHYLLEYDYDPMLINHPPYTRQMVEQKIESADDILQFVLTAIERETFDYSIVWEGEFTMLLLYDCYVEFCQKYSVRYIKSFGSFKMRIRKYLPMDKSELKWRKNEKGEQKKIRISVLPSIEDTKTWLNSEFDINTI